VNGTLFYTPTVNMILNRLTKEDQNEIKLLGQTQVVVFAQLNATLANGHDVIVEWYYPEDDEDMMETGKEYAELIKVPFKQIGYKFMID
jgi:hypothetical protein